MYYSIDIIQYISSVIFFINDLIETNFILQFSCRFTTISNNIED